MADWEGWIGAAAGVASFVAVVVTDRRSAARAGQGEANAEARERRALTRAAHAADVAHDSALQGYLTVTRQFRSGLRQSLPGDIDRAVVRFQTELEALATDSTFDPETRKLVGALKVEAHAYWWKTLNSGRLQWHSFVGERAEFIDAEIAQLEAKLRLKE